MIVWHSNYIYYSVLKWESTLSSAFHTSWCKHLFILYVTHTFIVVWYVSLVLFVVLLHSFKSLLTVISPTWINKDLYLWNSRKPSRLDVYTQNIMYLLKFVFKWLFINYLMSVHLNLLSFQKQRKQILTLFTSDQQMEPVVSVRPTSLCLQ